MRRIMMATDFSAGSGRALRRASLIAAAAGGELSVIHIADSDQTPRAREVARLQAEDRMRHLIAALPASGGGRTTGQVIMGDPFDGIAKAAAAQMPDLLVIGGHGGRGWRDLVMATMAERILRAVAVPVLVVNTAPAGDYRQVLMTTDLSDLSARALRRFLAMQIGESRALVHVYSTTALNTATAAALGDAARDHYLTEARHAAGAALSAFKNDLQAIDIFDFIRENEKSVAETLSLVTDEVGADLVVVATAGKTGLERFFLGSAARALIRTAVCDILAIPPDSTN
ncbi:MAG: universal stress protein [Paracoccus sp. (in: a-proteobacteria)]|nr:universal stress protein [Paracoccus sp. (in: a-proteobacteria)]